MMNTIQTALNNIILILKDIPFVKYIILLSISVLFNLLFFWVAAFKKTATEKVFEVHNAGSSAIIKALDQSDPNWRDKFVVSSPNETNEIILDFINNVISLNLLLHYLIIYFLVMLLFFIVAKKVLNSNVKEFGPFKWLNTTRIGKTFYSLFMKYLSFFKKSNSFWIYYIIAFLLFINCVSILSFLKILEILTHFQH